MEIKDVDLSGKICPFPIVYVINMVEKLEKGKTLKFKITDPLAIKSIPEELEEYENVAFKITKIENFWEFKIWLIN